MTYRNLTTAGMALAIALIQTPAAAQTADRPNLHVSSGRDANPPVLHVNPRWKECSFQLNSALTQTAWREFAREAGLVAYFRPLSDARPMGKRRFELSVLQSETGIDDHDAAWNDTFVHPDSAHWLFEGEGLKFPGLMARAGVGENTDVGMYFTKSPGANYGFFGAQVQRALINNPASAWAAAARVSFVSMYGPDDLEPARVRRGPADEPEVRSHPVGIRLALRRSLDVPVDGPREDRSGGSRDERVLGAQAMVGAALQVSKARLGVEYNVSKVNSLSIKVGIGS